MLYLVHIPLTIIQMHPVSSKIMRVRRATCPGDYTSVFVQSYIIPIYTRTQTPAPFTQSRLSFAYNDGTCRMNAEAQTRPNMLMMHKDSVKSICRLHILQSKPGPGNAPQAFAALCGSRRGFPASSPPVVFGPKWMDIFKILSCCRVGRPFSPLPCALALPQSPSS